MRDTSTPVFPKFMIIIVTLFPLSAKPREHAIIDGAKSFSMTSCNFVIIPKPINHGLSRYV